MATTKSPSLHRHQLSAKGCLDRAAALDWEKIAADLDDHGCAVIGPILTPEECRKLTAVYGNESLFRKTVVMAQHGFGRGEYRYFSYPLPELGDSLREALYPPLAEIANRWNKALRIDVRFPKELEEFTRRCHRAGQVKPTPLLLRY